MEASMKRKAYRFSFFVIIIYLFLSIPASGQGPSPSNFKLIIDEIMKGPEFVGTAPSNIMWSIDGKRLYFRWQKPSEKETNLYAITKSNLTPQKISPSELLKHPPLLSLSFFLYRFFS